MQHTAAVAPLRRLPPSLHTFTYRIPTQLSRQVRVGSVVHIPLHSRRYHGVVVAIEKNHPDSGTKLKDILAVTPVSVTEEQRSIAQFLSRFYVQSIGLIFNSFVASPPLRNLGTVSLPEPPKPSQHKTARNQKQGYRLYTSPGGLRDLLQELFADRRKGEQMLIITPDISLREQVLAVAQKIAGGSRVLALPRHTNRSEYLRAWYDSQIKPVVIGSLTGLLLPFRTLTHIVVIEAEHYLFQSAEQNPRYHLADMLFPVADTYGASVLITGYTPDIRLLWEVRKRKLPIALRGKNRENVTVVALTPGSFGRKTLPSEVTTIVRSHPESRVLLLYNRIGDIRLLQCRDCGTIPACNLCGRPYMLDTQRQKLICPTDLTEKTLSPRCPTCHGVNLDAKGRGIERLATELRQEFPDRPVVTFTRTNRDTLALNQDTVLALATKAILYTVVRPFDIAIWLKPEIELGNPSFHTAEEVRYVIKKLQAESGAAYLVTATPEHPVLTSHQSIPVFFKQEIAWRKKFSYPPFGTLYKGIIRAPSEHETKTMLATITHPLKKKPILGPHGRSIKNRYQLVFGYKVKSEVERRELDAAFRHPYNGFHLEINPYSLE